MGFLRSASKAVAGTLFIIFLGMALTLMGLASLTSYETLKPLAADIISQQFASSADQQQLPQLLDDAKQQCQGQSEIKLSSQNANLTIKCSDILAATPQDLPAVIASAAIDQTVKKSYACQPLDCLRTLQGSDRLFYIFSSEFNAFLGSIVIMLWIATAITGVGYFFALQGIEGRLKGFGIALITVGLPYFVMNFFFVSMLPTLLPPQASSAAPLFAKILGQMSNNFLYVFIAGAALLVGGFIVGFATKRKIK